jgi:hypothetical protein
MSQYDEVVAVMQVGTRRSARPPEGPFPDFTQVGDEKRALVMAGALDLMQRAGALPDNNIKALQPMSPGLDRVAHASAGPLGEALNGGATTAVLEWVTKAAKLKQVAPPSTLNRLLKLAKKHPEIKEVLGFRGLWLAQIQGLELEQQTLEARREIDPAEYRTWLEGEFGQMDWKERAAAVNVLRRHLTLDDEPLLEKALVDKRKEVREPACELLAGLPRSRVSAELAHLCRSLLTIEKGFLRKNLTVHPPEPDSLPKWLPRTAPYHEFGPKALAMLDVIRYVPPSNWNRELGLTPLQVIELAAKTDFGLAIQHGLQEAAVRFKDCDWIETLFAYVLDDDTDPSVYFYTMLNTVSNDAFDRCMLGRTSAKGKPMQAVLWSLSSRTMPFSAALSRALVLELRSDADRGYALHGLDNLLDPSVLPLLEKSVSDKPHLENTRIHVYKTLSLRKRLLDSLD